MGGFFLFLIIILVVGGLYGFITAHNHDEQLKKRLAEFYKKTHKTSAEVDEIRRWFKESEELFTETLNEYKESLKKKEYENELKRRELIIKRVLAYEYEEMLYQIYAPTPKEYGFTMSPLEGDFIIQRISEIKQIPINEAEDVFKKILSLGLLYVYRQGGKFYLTEMLATTFSNWNIVSDIDYNLVKWKKEHGYKDYIDYAN